MELLNKTGVPIKNPGDELSHKDINAINSTVNNAIDAINLTITNYCNVNQEINDFSKTFTFLEAIKLVPVVRRKSGLVVKYLSESRFYREYIFNYPGKTFTDEDWLLFDNWSLPFDQIDGGEWSLDDEF